MPKGHRAKKPGGSGAINSSHARAAGSSTARRGAASGTGGERVTRSSKAKLTNGLEDPAQVEKDLNKQLRSMGLYAANTMGDGNCLFRALSDQLYGYPHQHSILREKVCDYLAAMPDKFAAFVDIEKPFEEYVRTMRQSGTYGGHLELSAFAQLQQKEIKIVQPGLVYVVSGDDESPQATKEREKRERERQIAQSKTTPGTEGPPPSERELRRLRRERKLKGLDGEGPHLEKVGESSKMAWQSQNSSTEQDLDVSSTQNAAVAVAEAFGPLYIAYHNWEHYSSIRNIEGPHTGLPRIKEKSASSPADDTAVAVDDDEESAEPTEEEALVLRSTSGYSLQQVRFYIKRHGGWEEALEAILAQDAVDDDETEEDDTLSTTELSNPSSPDDAARADAAAGPSQAQANSPRVHGLLDHHDYYGHVPLPDHLRDWRAASPSSVDTIGTLSSVEGGSSSTHVTTDESPESASLTKRAAGRPEAKRSKRPASKDPMSSLRSPKRRSRSRSPMQPASNLQQVGASGGSGSVDEGNLAAQHLDALRVTGTPAEGEGEEEGKGKAGGSVKALSMRERRLVRQEEKARKAVEARDKRRERAMGVEESGEQHSSSQPSAHVRGFLELKI